MSRSLSHDTGALVSGSSGPDAAHVLGQGLIGVSGSGVCREQEQPVRADDGQGAGTAVLPAPGISPGLWPGLSKQRCDGAELWRNQTELCHEPKPARLMEEMGLSRRLFPRLRRWQGAEPGRAALSVGAFPAPPAHCKTTFWVNVGGTKGSLYRGPGRAELAAGHRGPAGPQRDAGAV